MLNGKISKKDKQAIGFTICLLLPAILHFCIFYLYINSQSFLLAFKDDNGFTLEYLDRFFKQVTTSGSDMSLSLRNTLIFFVFGNFLMLPLALFFSYLLYKKIAGYKYFRIVFFLPSIISAVVMVTLYRYVVNGPVYSIVTGITGEKLPPFLSSTETALSFILLYEFWLGIGGNMIIYAGAMSRVPQEVIESAKIDGIGFWGEFFQMVLPLIWPTLSTMLLLSFINIFGASGQILLFVPEMTDPKQIRTIAYWIFEQSTALVPDYNGAAAAGFVFTLIQLPIVFLVRYISQKLDSGVEY